jgi:hypothetical protein
MAGKAAQHPFAEEGDTYAEQLEDGRWGAIRVLRTCTTDTALVAVTAYLGTAPPTPNEPLLRCLQTVLWHGSALTPCARWYQGRPPSTLLWIIRIAPSAAEQGIGGKNAGWGFGGRWQHGVAWPVLRAWQWTHDRPAFDAWQLHAQATKARSIGPTPAAKKPRAHPMMSEERFWSLMGLITNDRQDEEAALLALAAALEKLAVSDIRSFDERLAATLHRLDGRVFAEQIGIYAFRDGAHFSVDNFLYARCEAVARGRAPFERALGAPEEMPKEATFESLLFVAQRAYEAKTGKTYDHTPATAYETFSNEAGWPK